MLNMLATGVFKFGDDVYLVYNDLAKNHEPGAKQKTLNVSGGFKKAVTVYVKIDGDGKVAKKQVDRSDSQKLGFIRVVYYDDESAILLYGSKKIDKTAKLRKVTF
jgi:hypothetical protein